MNTKRLIIFILFMGNITLWVLAIWVQYMLATGHQIWPDLQLGYSININLIELIVACIITVAQLILFIILWKKS